MALSSVCKGDVVQIFNEVPAYVYSADDAEDDWVSCTIARSSRTFTVVWLLELNSIQYGVLTLEQNRLQDIYDLDDEDLYFVPMSAVQVVDRSYTWTDEAIGTGAYKQGSDGPPSSLRQLVHGKAFTVLILGGRWCPACQSLLNNIPDNIGSSVLLLSLTGCFGEAQNSAQHWMERFPTDEPPEIPGTYHVVCYDKGVKFRDHLKKYNLNAVPAFLVYNAEGRYQGRAQFDEVGAMLRWSMDLDERVLEAIAALNVSSILLSSNSSSTGSGSACSDDSSEDDSFNSSLTAAGSRSAAGLQTAADSPSCVGSPAPDISENYFWFLPAKFKDLHSSEFNFVLVILDHIDDDDSKTLKTLCAALMKSKGLKLCVIEVSTQDELEGKPSRMPDLPHVVRYQTDPEDHPLIDKRLKELMQMFKANSVYLPSVIVLSGIGSVVTVPNIERLLRIEGMVGVDKQVDRHWESMRHPHTKHNKYKIKSQFHNVKTNQKLIMRGHDNFD